MNKVFCVTIEDLNIKHGERATLWRFFFSAKEKADIFLKGVSFMSKPNTCDYNIRTEEVEVL